VTRTTLSARTERWPAREVLRITGHTFECFEVVVVQLAREGCIGQGEALGIYYLGDTADTVLAAIESVRDAVEGGVDRRGLLELLPAGGARHALDSALWDLECKRLGVRCWAHAGTRPATLQAQLTLGIEDSAEATGRKAAALAQYPHLKLKVDRDDPISRIRAVRRARPDARIVVDANQAWTIDDLQAHADEMASLGVFMVEQPLARGSDQGLEAWRCPVPLCADESCLDASELPDAAARYQFINIKLDKVGGLTCGVWPTAWAFPSWSAACSQRRSPWRRPCCSRRRRSMPIWTGRCSSNRTGPTRFPIPRPWCRPLRRRFGARRRNGRDAGARPEPACRRRQSQTLP